ncbi:hypothetical protein [Actinokineospora sp. UTMC 2448]|uniref:hypothetical protein n=1 Tax=Actinokineospora sp. UTMC 2448 TaxID=2268449 RepID=UPI002164E274|nr:hypothetical protein [Actinokineospora sp. UTMC 2448]UVS78422.1 hypothetical protein Actkin_02155 [Actinokineospora sp. UTMC 2448]
MPERRLAEQLAKDVGRILDRLVDREEFAAEIERMGLHPGSVVNEVARDPAVLARAQVEYEPVNHLWDRMTAHRQARPKAWPADWQPTVEDVRLLYGAAITFFVAALLDLFVSDLLLSRLVEFAVLILTGAAIAMLLFGLPPSVRTWLRWAVDHVRLAAGLPTRWWEIQRELRDEVLIPELRGWLGGQANPQFSTMLRLRDASGLMIPAGQGPLVPTAAVRACVREINRGTSAAVGVAGSRGAGKTTIVDRAVRNEFTDPERARVLGVLTTAPVRYDARDFVLHVHASVCRAVLDELSSPDGPRRSDSRRHWTRRHRLYQLRSTAWTWLRGLIQCAAILVAAFCVIHLGWRRDGDAVMDPLARVVPFAESFEKQPREVISTAPLQGLALVALVFLAAVTVWIAVRSFAIPLFNGLTSAVSAFVDSRLKRKRTPAEAALCAVARQQLRRIRFLQTRTSGWSGKISGMGGIEPVPTRSTANAEQPLTYPEVVERLRDFLELVGDVLITTRLSAIVIAIDELDKIADPDEAHSFLNDIKGIFGVRHCVYLVSVSEDALTAFERRGMPARDAFDSAFTSMIRVDPFTLGESQRWLAYRAIGIPKPFIWLCHCLSGGLPRDLARVAIAVHDLGETHRSLGEFAQAVVSADITDKCHAYVHAARQLADQDDGIPAVIEFLIGMSNEIHERGHGDITWKTVSAGASPGGIRLRSEIDCYLTFCRPYSKSSPTMSASTSTARTPRTTGGQPSNFWPRSAA